MSDPIDQHPDRRTAQIAAARKTLRDGRSDRLALRQACDVILALSADPLDRMQATELLKAGNRET
jgi:hypothetical protein